MDEAHEMELGHEAQGLQHDAQMQAELTSLRASLETAGNYTANLNSELASLRERVEGLEEVRKAAANFMGLFDNGSETSDQYRLDVGAKLREALRNAAK